MLGESELQGGDYLLEHLWRGRDHVEVVCEGEHPNPEGLELALDGGVLAVEERALPAPATLRPALVHDGEQAVEAEGEEVGADAMSLSHPTEQLDRVGSQWSEGEYALSASGKYSRSRAWVASESHELLGSELKMNGCSRLSKAAFRSSFPTQTGFLHSTAFSVASLRAWMTSWAWKFLRKQREMGESLCSSGASKSYKMRR